MAVVNGDVKAAPLRIALVGGGIAGLTAAIAFTHYQKQNSEANIRLDVYESASAFGEIGAGVSLGPNAQKTLRMIGCGEVLEKVAGKPGQEQDDDDLWFDYLIGEKDHPDSGKGICAVKGAGAGRGNVHRADFLNELIKMLPSDCAHFKKRAQSYTPHSSGVTLHFADETSAEADLIIASDGIKSKLRQDMYEKKGIDLELQRARYSEWIAWRGLIKREEFEAIPGIGNSLKRMILGQGAHILHFPVRGGALVNVVGFVNDPKHAKLGDHNGPWSEPRPKAEMLEDYKNFDEATLSMLKAIKDPSIWGIFDLPLIPTATSEGIVIIGDAAHATTPHQGSGAGQAIEDGLFIAAILSDPSVSSTSLSSRPTALSKALRVYEQTRHARGQKVQSTSREAGLLYEFLDPECKDDTKKIVENLGRRMKWIWDWDVEAELTKALKLLHC